MEREEGEKLWRGGSTSIKINGMGDGLQRKVRVCIHADSTRSVLSLSRVPSAEDHACRQCPLITIGSASSKQRVLIFHTKIGRLVFALCANRVAKRWVNVTLAKKARGSGMRLPKQPGSAC